MLSVCCSDQCGHAENGEANRTDDERADAIYFRNLHEASLTSVDRLDLIHNSTFWRTEKRRDLEPVFACPVFRVRKERLREEVKEWGSILRAPERPFAKA